MTSLENNYIREGYRQGAEKIEDLTGLEHATAMTTLSLPYHDVSNITALQNLTQLTSLDLRNNYGISDYSPLSGLTNLTSLNLVNTYISDITSLSGLTKLTALNIGVDFYGTLFGESELSDIGSLANLTELTSLRLSDTEVRDISHLSGLTKLTTLSLSKTEVRDISHLSGLTKLTTLSLNDTKVRSISTLSNLTKLKVLYLSGNKIVDISPLTGLTNLGYLTLNGNPVVNTLPLCPLLRANGGNLYYVDIEVTNCPPANNAPEFTEGTSTTRSVAENTASGTHIGAVVSATDADTDDTLTYSLGGTDAATFEIDATDGQLKIKAPLDYETKSTYTVTVSVSDGNDGSDSITVTINVTDVAEITPPLSERTPQVRAAILRATGVESADDVTVAHLAAITSLNLGAQAISSLKAGDFNGLTALTSLEMAGNSISNISALEGLTTLTYLNLTSNAISDISPLEGLTALTELYLGRNSVSDISALEGLTALEWLYLFSNSISDISALENLTSLIRLNLNSNSISDISALENLTALPRLALQNNSISDISALENLTSLITLSLYGNSVTNISALEGLTKLTLLNLDRNSISDISALEGLTKLTSLALSSNSINDISALKDLTALTYLNLNSNSVSDVSTLEGLTSLAYLYLSGNPISDYEPLRKLLAAIKATAGHPGLTLNITIPPVFTDGTSTTRSVAENTAARQNIGTAIAATDVDTGDTLTYTLGGTDAASFSIVSTSGQLQTKAALDYETKNAYSVTVSVSDGNDGTDSIDVTINVTDVDEAGNDPPTFTDGTSTTRSIAENTTSGSNIGTAVAATDSDSADTLTYTLGGTDAASFGIVSTSGQLQTSAALDYETKTSYSVTVSVSDGNGASDSIDVTINVTDVNETVATVSTDITTCSVSHKSGNVYDVTIAGTVTGNQNVRFLIVHGYVNDDPDEIGRDSVGFLDAGETKNFSITGTWTHDGSTSQECSVVLTYQVLRGNNAPVAQLVPSETALLPNYPNPFNPETWIPYQLVEPSEVTVTIYDVRGRIVRTLRLGHQPAGIYQSRSKAVHWDGRNQLGEKVATGVYFYTLKAGDYTATRKLLIRK